MKLPSTPRRVVVTGMAAISPIGSTWEEVRASLRANKSGIRHMTEWEKLEDLNTRVAAPAAPFELDPAVFTRKRTRSMGRVALMAVKTARDALIDAGLLDDPVIASPRTGVAFGSSVGQPAAVAELAHLILSSSCRGITATTYVRMMAHTAPVNISVFFGCKGRICTTSSACTSGSQGIGSAYEAIATGRADVMIAGGAEATVCKLGIGGFDAMHALSRRNDEPEKASRPFDVDRDGFVMGEGSGVLVLEELEHAKARGAKIYAEVVGYGLSGDAHHITTPATDGPVRCMRMALRHAGMNPDDIDYLNAHGTSTSVGDANEVKAIREVFGEHAKKLVVNSTKSMTGHLLGGAGGIESVFSVMAVAEQVSPPTINLDKVDPECEGIDFCANQARKMTIRAAMKNSFGFGGTNSTVIYKRYEA